MTGLLGTYFPGEDPMAPVDLMPRGLLGPSVLGRMQAHGDAQRQRMAAGDYSPTPMDEESMWLADDLAGGILGSLPGGVMGAIKAYHGSPHRFDKFDLGKIGTGEGAQAFGRGLYFTETPDIARNYAEQVARVRPVRPIDADLDTAGSHRWDLFDEVIRPLMDGKIDKKEMGRRLALRNMKTMYKRPDDGDARARISILEDSLRKNGSHEGTEAELQWLRENADAFAYPEGSVYTARINVTDEDLLDWDVPISQQSRSLVDRVKATLKNVDGLEWSDNLDGGELMVKLGNAIGEEEAASRLLGQGIKGIRYLDGFSREAGEGTRNFVIFDDKLIDIEGVE